MTHLVVRRPLCAGWPTSITLADERIRVDAASIVPYSIGAEGQAIVQTTRIIRLQWSKSREWHGVSVDPCERALTQAIGRPNTAARAQELSYPITASDPDGDTLAYRLVEGSVDATTGVLVWNPSNLDAGMHTFKVAVDDGRGGTAEQTFVLTITVAKKPA